MLNQSTVCPRIFRETAANDAFTLLNLIAAVAAVGILAMIAMVVLIGSARRGAYFAYDAMQVRGIHQGMFEWAQDNQDRFPLPSSIDLDNTTVPQEGHAKDTTANILSILVFHSFVSVKIFISPAESNDLIVACENYEFDEPSTAVDPPNALWDPVFKTDFTSGKAHNSYAHQLPRGPTADARWTSSFNATEPIIGNRGPEISSVSYDANGVPSPSHANQKSNTFLIHGSKNAWAGNIAYNDNHVSFESTLAPEGLTYVLNNGTTRPDVLFYDEQNAAAGINAYLGIFTKAGPEPKHFKAIWD